MVVIMRYGVAFSVFVVAAILALCNRASAGDKMFDKLMEDGE